MSDFKDFMLNNVEPIENEVEVKLSRFKSPFRVKALTSAEEQECRNEATKKTKIGKNRFRSELDTLQYQNLLALKAITYPNLNDIDLQNSYNKPNKPPIKSAEQLLLAMFKAGELLALIGKINEISGFDEDTDLVEEAKN